MIPRDKLRSILERLLDRSRLDQVRWAMAPSDSSSPKFQVRFPNSMLAIQFHSPTARDDFYEVAFSNSGGELVDASNIGERDELFGMVDVLYGEAHRYVTGWSKVLEDIERGVNSDEFVGLPVGNLSENAAL